MMLRSLIRSPRGYMPGGISLSFFSLWEYLRLVRVASDQQPRMLWGRMVHWSAFGLYLTVTSVLPLTKSFKTRLKFFVVNVYHKISGLQMWTTETGCAVGDRRARAPGAALSGSSSLSLSVPFLEIWLLALYAPSLLLFLPSTLALSFRLLEYCYFFSYLKVRGYYENMYDTD